MLDYMIALMDDANNFSWSSAKTSHAVLLCCMEQGEVKNFADTMAIEHIQRANAQKLGPVNQFSNVANQNFGKQIAKTTRSMPCNYFNQGICLQGKSHETKGGLIQAYMCFLFC